MLVVVTPDPVVAAWAARPLRLGHPGVSLRPIVIGPDEVPVVRDGAEAAAAPEILVLSAMMHGKGEGAEDIARAAFAAVRGLDAERATLYTDVILVSLRAAARGILEDFMANGTYQYQSDFAKRYVAEGEARGRAEGKALAVLAVLTTRGVDVPPQIHERIVACTDMATLDVWLARAITAQAAADVVSE